MMDNNKVYEFYFTSLSNSQHVDKFERAKIIKEYMQINDVSIRKFALLFNLKRSTVEDWLLYNRISEQEYQEKVSEGMKPIEIYRNLRENKNKKKVVFKTSIDRVLEDCSKEISKFSRSGTSLNVSDETPRLLHNLKDLLNRVQMRMEKLK